MTLRERWMPGRKSGRTLYIHQGDEEYGQLVGTVDTPALAARICDAMNARPERWWVHVPVLSDAFQVEMLQDDDERGLWWGNQIVGHAVRREHGQWAATGRDGVPLPPGAALEVRHATAEAALIQARDAWRQRDVHVSHDLGEDYWIEPRAAAGVDSLWLGRIHLGYVRPCPDGTYEAFTTNNEQLEPDHSDGRRNFPTRDEGLLAVRGAWRTHLRRILRVTGQPH
ncbi:hypothetical protein [Actinomadura algeriensis]|uniref:Uncharacterized protein n=1 Tax=Actinomadura algeriensis TaxID=1679523 RepID=A0ABR9K2I1_9ACTN|nr:hypothetical protein [Actinomadura algeriensis]MBE1537070.1 hypothetical protein [Actinomadura algeriensis]